MIILDASVLIAHLEEEDIHHVEAVNLLLSIIDRDQPIAASPMTLAEVLVGPVRAGELSRAQSLIRQLGVEELPLPPGAPAQLADIRVRTKLKLPDCCVLLAAQQLKAEAVATFDDKLGIAAEKLGFERA